MLSFECVQDAKQNAMTGNMDRLTDRISLEGGRLLRSSRSSFLRNTRRIINDRIEAHRWHSIAKTTS